MGQLLNIFVNVITPVFALSALGYLVGPRLGLEARSLARYTYYLLVPSFVFNVITTAEVDPGLMLRMVGYIVLVELAVGGLAVLTGVLLRKSADMTAAFVLLATFPNVGNFGLPIVEFHLGRDGLLPATVYFLVVVVVGFLVGVLAAGWRKGGASTAVISVLKTPALMAAVPALLINAFDIAIPLPISRAVGLLGSALVPTMLISLGVQLAGARLVRLNGDVLIGALIRLLGGPALALALVGLFGLSGIERAAGVIQQGMPAAVLCAMIAVEYDLLPEYVTTTVLVSTLGSVITVTILLAIL